MIVIVTSATLDAEKFINYYSSVVDVPPLLEIPGRMFPVDDVYIPTREGSKIVNEAVKLCSELHQRSNIQGDILVFMARQEVHKTID